MANNSATYKMNKRQNLFTIIEEMEEINDKGEKVYYLDPEANVLVKKNGERRKMKIMVNEASNKVKYFHADDPLCELDSLTAEAEKKLPCHIKAKRSIRKFFNRKYNGKTLCQWFNKIIKCLILLAVLLGIVAMVAYIFIMFAMGNEKARQTKEK